MCRVMRHYFDKVSLRKNILFRIFCSTQTHGQSLIIIHKNYDYVEKPNMNIMTELIECLFVEVIVQTRKHKREILVGIV